MESRIAPLLGRHRYASDYLTMESTDRNDPSDARSQYGILLCSITSQPNSFPYDAPALFCGGLLLRNDPCRRPATVIMEKMRSASQDFFRQDPTPPFSKKSAKSRWRVDGGDFCIYNSTSQRQDITLRTKVKRPQTIAIELKLYIHTA